MVEAILEDYTTLIALEREIIKNASENTYTEATTKMIADFMKFQEKNQLNVKGIQWQ